MQEEKLMSEEEFIAAGEKIKVTWKFPNNMVVTCDKRGQQVGFLQGPYTKALYARLKEFSDLDTEWNGFN